MSIIKFAEEPISKYRNHPFFCPRVTCSALPEEGAWEGGGPGPNALRVLLAFERLLVKRTHPGQLIDPWWVGPADSTQFLQLIDDLAWALLHSHRDTRPIYHLQISAFPLPIHRFFRGRPASLVLRLTREIRRALFAVILALAGPEEGRVALTGSKLEPRFPELLTFLGYREEMELRRRSYLWPLGVRDRLHRAFRSPRLRRRLLQQRRTFPALRNSIHSV